MVIYDYIGKYCIINHETKMIGELNIIKAGKIVYEVVRIVNRVPLFLEEHFLRLDKSVSLIGTHFIYDLEIIRADIEKLISLEQLENCNVKIVTSVVDNFQVIAIYLSKFYYPSIKEYSEGVYASLINIERENPNIKKINTSYIDTIYKKVIETKAFEILLVNSRNEILEGSKSNIFFVKGEKVFTSPDDLVLKGITRSFVINICDRLGIDLIQTVISINYLSNIEAVFLTGTSIKVLPIAKIENHSFSSASNKIVVSILKKYDELINDYIVENNIK
ncbi:UNVERIFIED_CONTAM: branched-chain amino acid aminotransferase [Acetivibrio alkalicellulosi]